MYSRCQETQRWEDDTKRVSCHDVPVEELRTSPKWRRLVTTWWNTVDRATLQEVNNDSFASARVRCHSERERQQPGLWGSLQRRIRVRWARRLVPGEMRLHLPRPN